jgi:hypothetical protein
MSVDNFGKAAADYAAAGLHIFPCAAKSKLPVAGGRGFHDATDDVDTVERIWRERPTLNPAVALGASGLFAVDIEVPEHDWLDQLPPTWTQRTPGGGWHLLYRQPQGKPIPSVPLGQLAPDVEIKGDGGYVLLAPSRATSKKLAGGLGVYTLAVAQAPAEAPQWIVDMVRARESQRRRAAEQVYSSVRVGGGADDRIAALLDDLRSTGEGARNVKLISVAASIGRVVAGGFLSLADAEARLRSVVAPWGNPRKDHGCIARGLRAGQMSDPWYPDEASTLTAEESARMDELVRRAVEEADKETPPEDSGGAVGADTGGEPDRASVARSPDDVQREIFGRVRALGGLCDTFSAWQARGAIRHQPLFFALATVALGSTLAARRYVYRGSTSPIYAVVVGDTSAGKGRPQKCLEEALSITAPDLRGPGNIVSSKALWTTLSTASKAGHGVCYTVDEFGEMLGTLTSTRRNPNQADLYGWILKLASIGTGTMVWGNSAAEGAGKDVAKSPSLVLFGGTTPSSFFAAVKGKQAADGFLNRILIGIAQAETPKKNREAWRDGDEVPSEVLAGLSTLWKRVSAAARAVGDGGTVIDPAPVVVQETPGAGSMLTTWDDAVEDMTGLGRDLRARSLELAQRVALSLAVLRTPDREPVIDEDVAEVATAIVDVCMAGVQRVIEEHGAENDVERDFKTVVRVVQEALAPGRPVALRAVSRRLRHLRSKVLAEHLDRGASEQLWVWGDARTPEEKKAGGHKRVMVAPWKEEVDA